jgi:UDP:flavonoid glycosyltransferase YjiC (YdhE family)
MQILFTTNPMLGHFLPLVPLAHALQSVGHTVAFAAPAIAPTRQPFEPDVNAAGFQLLSVGATDYLETDAGWGEVRQFAATRPDPRELHRFGLTRLFPEIAPRAILADLVEVCERWRPDLIVSDNLEYAGRVAAESHAIPHATIAVDTSVQYAGRHSIVPQMDRLRASVGLAPDPHGEMQFRYLHLVNEPPELLPDVELPPTAVRMQRSIGDGDTLPDWVASLPRRPTVYATAGTFVSRFPGVLERLLEAMVSEPVNLILTVGYDRDPGSFGLQPPGVHIDRYIPQSRLMPYCEAVLAHGGTGTVYTALEFGLPVVNVPIGADQFVTSERCANVGAGLVIGPEERSPEAIRAGVREVLSSGAYRDKARHIRQAIHALPSPADVVPLLERLAAEKQPIVRSATSLYR